jgi:hypothetical protein
MAGWKFGYPSQKRPSERPYWTGVSNAEPRVRRVLDLTWETPLKEKR